ncbi:hypothetical protein Emed_006254 [Eimeria media]
MGRTQGGSGGGRLRRSVWRLTACWCFLTLIFLSWAASASEEEDEQQQQQQPPLPISSSSEDIEQAGVPGSESESALESADDIIPRQEEDASGLVGDTDDTQGTAESIPLSSSSSGSSFEAVSAPGGDQESGEEEGEKGEDKRRSSSPSESDTSSSSDSFEAVPAPSGGEDSAASGLSDFESAAAALLQSIGDSFLFPPPPPSDEEQRESAGDETASSQQEEEEKAEADKTEARRDAPTPPPPQELETPSQRELSPAPVVREEAAEGSSQPPLGEKEEEEEKADDAQVRGGLEEARSVGPAVVLPLGAPLGQGVVEAPVLPPEEEAVDEIPQPREDAGQIDAAPAVPPAAREVAQAIPLGAADDVAPVPPVGAVDEPLIIPEVAPLPLRGGDDEAATTPQAAEGAAPIPLGPIPLGQAEGAAPIPLGPAGEGAPIPLGPAQLVGVVPLGPEDEEEPIALGGAEGVASAPLAPKEESELDESDDEGEGGAHAGLIGEDLEPQALSLRYQMATMKLLRRSITYKETGTGSSLVERMLQEHAKHLGLIERVLQRKDYSMLLLENAQVVGGFRGSVDTDMSQLLIHDILLTPDVIDRTRAARLMMQTIIEGAYSWEAKEVHVSCFEHDYDTASTLAQLGFDLVTYEAARDGVPPKWGWTITLPPQPAMKIRTILAQARLTEEQMKEKMNILERQRFLPQTAERYKDLTEPEKQRAARFIKERVTKADDILQQPFLLGSENTYSYVCSEEDELSVMGVLGAVCEGNDVQVQFWGAADEVDCYTRGLMLSRLMGDAIRDEKDKIVIKGVSAEDTQTLRVLFDFQFRAERGEEGIDFTWDCSQRLLNIDTILASYKLSTSSLIF